MALSMDVYSTGSASSGSSAHLTITTTKTNDIIVLIVGSGNLNTSGSTSAPFVSSVSGGGLTWAMRGRSLSTSIGNDPSTSTPWLVDLEIWWAASPSILSSQTITASLSSSISGTAAKQITLLAFAVNGADMNTPWDVNSGLPAQASSTTAGARPTVNSSVSTTNANTVLLGITVMGSETGSAVVGSLGASYSAIASSGSTVIIDGEFQIVSAVQSSVTVGFGTNENKGGGSAGFFMFADAIQAAPTDVLYSQACL